MSTQHPRRQTNENKKERRSCDGQWLLLIRSSIFGGFRYLLYDWYVSYDIYDLSYDIYDLVQIGYWRTLCAKMSNSFYYRTVHTAQ